MALFNQLNNKVLTQSDSEHSEGKCECEGEGRRGRERELVIGSVNACLKGHVFQGCSDCVSAQEERKKVRHRMKQTDEI